MTVPGFFFLNNFLFSYSMSAEIVEAAAQRLAGAVVLRVAHHALDIFVAVRRR